MLFIWLSAIFHGAAENGGDSATSEENINQKLLWYVMACVHGRFVRLDAHCVVPTATQNGDLGIQQLSEAVRAIHANHATALSLEQYYKMVESACAEGKDQLLYTSLRQICNEHLHQQYGQLIRYP